MRRDGDGGSFRPANRSKTSHSPYTEPFSAIAEAEKVRQSLHTSQPKPEAMRIRAGSRAEACEPIHP